MENNELLQELKGMRQDIQKLIGVMQQQPKQFLSKQEVAKLLDVSLATVDRLTKRGTLKVHKMGTLVRYKREEIMSAI